MPWGAGGTGAHSPPELERLGLSQERPKTWFLWCEVGPQLPWVKAACKGLPVTCLFCPQMEKALANLALRTAETSATEQEVPKASPTGTPSALRGVSQSLLERVSSLVLGWPVAVLGGSTGLTQPSSPSPRSEPRRRRSCRP